MKQPQLSSRVSTIAVSATKAMAAKAAPLRNVVSLGQGVPSFATPPQVIEKIAHLLSSTPACGKYTLQNGMADLREKIAANLLKEQGLSVDPQEEICITVGAMEGLLATLMSLVDPGDEVILPTPSYASYIEQVQLCGGLPVYAPLRADWSIDLETIEAAITPRTRALMLCNPGNPTGNVIPNETVTALADLAVAHNFVLILDATYDYLVYDHEAICNPFKLSPYRNHLACVSSFSKKYGLTGWRVGYVLAAPHLMEGIMKVHDATTICAPTPSQFAALAALDLTGDWLENCLKKLKLRKELCCQRLDALAEFFDYVPPQGAFYVMGRYRFSKEPSHRVAESLLTKAGVITIPGASYGPGGEGHLRLSFGGEEDEINAAFDRIASYLS